MLLIELLEVIDENVSVNIYDADEGKLLSNYDGRNSIDPSLNLSDVAIITRGLFNSMGLEDTLDVYVHPNIKAL